MVSQIDAQSDLGALRLFEQVRRARPVFMSNRTPKSGSAWTPGIFRD